MILNIRGTNGSGKSTLVAGVFARFLPVENIYGILGPRKPEAYRLPLSKNSALYVLGPYLTPAGGVDCIQPYDNIPPLIEKYAQKGHVLFEGVLVSKTKGQVGACLEQWGKQSVLLFLDTSLEECIRSVQKRRDTRGDGRPFSPHNLSEAYKSTLRVRKTLLKEDKLRIMDISRESGLQVILRLLKEA